MNTPSHFPLNRRRLLCGCAGLATLSLLGCGQSGDAAAGASAPAEISAQASCSLDGMLLADYPGPKGQIRYDGVAEVQWFCDSVELLSVLIAPAQVRAVVSAHVQGMALADWDEPRGHWMEAREALCVLGRTRYGSMGPTAASFATEAAAQAFVQQHGGRLLRYADLKPDMVDLSGGALHDTRM